MAETRKWSGRILLSEWADPNAPSPMADPRRIPETCPIDGTPMNLCTHHPGHGDEPGDDE